VPITTEVFINYTVLLKYTGYLKFSVPGDWLECSDVARATSLAVRSDLDGLDQLPESAALCVASGLCSGVIRSRRYLQGTGGKILDYSA
jgi:hypothetical protein